MTETKDIGKPSLWIPITDKQCLAALGKLGEEANELGAIVCRCIIQGVNGIDPKTKKRNLDALRDEIADVRGLSLLVQQMFDLNHNEIDSRACAKMMMKAEWIGMLSDENLAGLVRGTATSAAGGSDTSTTGT